MRILTGRDRAAYESLVEQNGRFLAHVERLEGALTAALEREQQWEGRWAQAMDRANRAVDAQLAVRGFPTVTPREGMPDIPDVLEEDPDKVAAVEARMSKGDATVFAERW